MAGQDRREQTQIMPKRQELALFGEPKRFRKDGGGVRGGSEVGARLGGSQH